MPSISHSMRGRRIAAPKQPVREYFSYDYESWSGVIAVLIVAALIFAGGYVVGYAAGRITSELVPELDRTPESRSVPSYSSPYPIQSDHI